ncbi:hypothetical protein PM082_009579 [Marasmius tenuissimus]|nr:hypothetical protein PM082_009579 [Marasmius tenuissimus]
MSPQGTPKHNREARQRAAPYATPPTTPKEKQSKTKGKDNDDKDKDKDKDQKIGKAFSLLLELREGAIIGIDEKRKEAEVEQLEAWIQEQKGQVTCPLCNNLFAEPQFECLNEAKANQTRRDATWKGEPLVCPDEGCKEIVVFGPVTDTKLEAITKRFAEEMGWKVPEGPGVSFWPSVSSILYYDVDKQRERNQTIEAGMRGLN